MSKLDRYIASKYDNDPKWFVEEVKSFANQDKVREIEGIRDYLDGKHKILKRQAYKYNGEIFEPKKIVLQTAKTLLDFQRQHLLHHPITLTGNEEVAKEISKVNKKGKYERFNRKILDKVLKFGEVYEYVYRDGNKIKSKVIEPDQGFPIYDHENVMIGFIEAYIHDGIEYYNVFKDDVVEQYKHIDSKIEGIARFSNLSGLPIVYKSENEVSDIRGRSQLQDWITILDSMEDLLSKYQDSVYKFMNPIPVAIGQQLKDSLPSDVIGAGLNLDDNSDFKMVGNKLDFNSFNAVYEKLIQALLDISSTPAVSMNKAEISNISETSIKLLFSLANTRASINQQFMEDGIEQRHDKFRQLLIYDGVTFNDDDFETIDVEFTYNIPSNNTEIIENLAHLRGIGAMSMETLLEKSPYITDVAVEMDRLKGESINGADTNVQDDVNKDIVGMAEYIS